MLSAAARPGLRSLLEKAPLWLLGIQRQTPGCPSPDAAAQKPESARRADRHLTALWPDSKPAGACLRTVCVCVRAQGTRSAVCAPGRQSSRAPSLFRLAAASSGLLSPGALSSAITPEEGGRGISRGKAAVTGASKIPSCCPHGVYWRSAVLRSGRLPRTLGWGAGRGGERGSSEGHGRWVESLPEPGLKPVG